MGLVAVPRLRRVGLDPEKRQQLLDQLGRGLRAVGWASLAALAASGLLMLRQRGITAAAFFGADPAAAAAAGWFLEFLRIKLGLVAFLIVLLISHDLTGPMATNVDPDSPRGRRLRLWSSWGGRLLTLISLIILYYAIRLARG